MSRTQGGKQPTKNGVPDDMPSLVTAGETAKLTSVATSSLGPYSTQDTLNPSIDSLAAAEEEEEEDEWDEYEGGQERKKKRCRKLDDDDDDDYDDDSEARANLALQKKRQTRREQQATEDPDVDFETLVKEEFKKLHRQYRLMEDARRAIAGQSGKLGKQGRLLELLRKEKEDLLTDLKNATCRQFKARDKQTISTILEALERYEKYKSDITACLMSIAEMEANVDRITQRLVNQRLKVQAMYGQSMTVSQADHRKRVLENRLYHATTQTDTLVSQNKELKAEINMMLKLRGSFYRRMLHIKKVSGKIKQRMGEVVYEATSAYDQRDDWMNKINVLRERNDKDSKQHVLEIKEFQRVLHHDSKIHEFLAIKNRDRDLLENTAQRMDRKNRGKINDLDGLLHAYKRSFRAILSMAKSRDIDTLVNAYLEEEHKNYAMFKFITDLNHETNCLQDEIGRIKEEIEQLSQESRKNSFREEQTLTDYDTQLEEATKKLDATLKEWSAADKTLEEFGNLLDQAFSMAGCSNAPILALLGNQNGMGPHNICLCMKALEHRVTELLFEKGMLEVRKSVEIDGNPLPKKPQLWTQGQKPAPQGGPYKPIVHVTGRVDSEQEEDDAEMKEWSERPIYYAEIKKLIKQSMQPMGAPGEGGGGGPEATKSKRSSNTPQPQYQSALPSKKKGKQVSISETESERPSTATVDQSETRKTETQASEE